MISPNHFVKLLHLSLIKRFAAIAFIFLFSTAHSSLNAQQIDNWQWMNPKPQGNSIFAMDFVNNNIGYIAGDFGTFMRTTDNGVS